MQGCWMKINQFKKFYFAVRKNDQESTRECKEVKVPIQAILKQTEMHEA